MVIQANHLRWGSRLRLVFLSALLTAAMLLPRPAQAADAPAVAKLPRQRVESADYRASGHLVRVQANGIRLSYPITIKAHWFPGVLRVYLELGTASKTGAKPVPGFPVHILLEMRPNGQDMVQIAHPGDAAPVILPFDKWSDGPLGSGFSYEDFLEEQYFWQGQTALDKAKFGARDCDVLESTPGVADKTHYTEVKSWLDHAIGFPVYVAKTLKGGAVKEFTYFGLRQNGGVWSASQIEAKIRGQAGSTLLILDRGSPKANLGLKDFAPAQLTRF
jgi:hypothetical protein